MNALERRMGAFDRRLSEELDEIERHRPLAQRWPALAA